jgi:endonuclease/exonuclease/phosphatase family metal-dependent hydrolase
MPSLKDFLRTVIAAVLFLAITGVNVATAQSVKVMTYNVDEGTDFDAIVALLSNPTATAADFQQAIEQTIAEVQSSHPEIRAHLIASAIASAQPNLVGLQEAAVWTFPGGQIDLLQLILTALGGQYTDVVTVPEFQINIRRLGVSFVDRDVILARTDELNTSALEITATRQGHYSVLVPLPAFPPYLRASHITRGWGYVDVRRNGTAFRFITTHLEDGTNPISIFALVQAAQAAELVYFPARTRLPVFIGGDFNTVADDQTSPTFLTYQFILANGFTDAWSAIYPGPGGDTCCYADLTSQASVLTQRLDLVFTRNIVSVDGAQLVGNQFDVGPPGFWPSDHAGVSVDATP